MPKFKEFFVGKKSKVKKVSKTSKEQDELAALIRQGLESGEGPYADLFKSFNEEEFNADFAKGVSDPALKNFQEKILPQLQEKFIAGNQVMGSGRQRAEASAASDLQSKLAELMYNAKYQQKNQINQNKLAGFQSLYNKQGVENVYKPGTEGVLKPALVAAASAAGSAAGSGGGSGASGAVAG